MLECRDTINFLQHYHIWLAIVKSVNLDQSKFIFEEFLFYHWCLFDLFNDCHNKTVNCIFFNENCSTFQHIANVMKERIFSKHFFELMRKIVWENWALNQTLPWTSLKFIKTEKPQDRKIIEVVESSPKVRKIIVSKFLPKKLVLSRGYCLVYYWFSSHTAVGQWSCTWKYLSLVVD